MRRPKEELFPPFAILNPNKPWIMKEIDKLLQEWQEWLEFAQELAAQPDSPEYHPNTCAEVIKDGRENIRKHELMREKTLVFMRNNFSGYEFVLEKWPSHPHEDNLSRLQSKIPGWIHKLELLKASMNYVIVPESFWRERGKDLIKKITDLAPEKALDIVTSYLKNPTAGD
jgi:hypothetical protein